MNNIDDAYARFSNKKDLIEYFCKYELYYQISLGNYAYLTTLDINDTLANLTNLNLSVDASKMIENLHNIIEHFSCEDDFEEKFDDYVKRIACLNSLEDFVKSDKEFLSPEHFTASTAESILDNSFFNESMQKQFDDSFDDNLCRWYGIVKF
jgi:uncharacterized protein YeeX (DUF496 family)